MTSLHAFTWGKGRGRDEGMTFAVGCMYMSLSRTCGNVEQFDLAFWSLPL